MEHISRCALASLTLALLACGCSVDRTDHSTLERVSESPMVSPDAEAVSPAPTNAFRALPSVAEVLASVPEGRADPFAPVPQSNAVLPAPDISELGASGDQDWQVIGVLSVGDQLRALIRTAEGSGMVCLGEGGRCPGHGEGLFSMDVAVEEINMRRGCLTLMRSGKSQRRCMT